MNLFYDEGSRLDLDLIVQNYEEDRERYWSDDEEGARYIALVDGIARFLLGGTAGLVQPRSDPAKPEAFTWEQARFLAELDPVSERVYERIEIDVAWAFSVETRAMAQRCLELAREVIAAEPNEAVLRYLRRLSRCYIAGFHPECVILCRAAVENALNEAFDRKPGTKAGRSSMAARLDSAVSLRLLTQVRREDAWLVWTRGNKAVHEDPEATRDILATIRLTLGVLKELYST
jgi:hypothetical protein